MKKGLLLNSEVSAVIAQMGHTDMLTLGDCGLPINQAKRIDLALKRGVPGFLETLDAVLTELCVEKVILSKEIKTVSPEMHQAILSRFGETVKFEYLQHEEFKKRTEDSKAVIRTGECTSFANVILVSGVAFHE